MVSAILSLDDDPLIEVFYTLSIYDIVILRRTCKRFNIISRLPVLWRRKLAEIAREGLPFPPFFNQTPTSNELEDACIRAFRRGLFWKDAIASPHTHRNKKSLQIEESSFDASGIQGISVSDVRIVRGGAGSRLVTISKGIWSALILWDLEASPPREVARWTSQGSIFRGFVVNDTPSAEALIAISVSRDYVFRTVVLALGLRGTLREVYAITTTDTPTALTGSMLALSDATLQTTLVDLSKMANIAILRSTNDLPGANLRPGQLSNTCAEIIFVEDCAFVVRARSVELFLLPSNWKEGVSHRADPPTLSPMAWHSFGWVDHITVVPRYTSHLKLPTLDVLIRTKSTDLWHPSPESIELWTFEPQLWDMSISEAVNDRETPNLPYFFPPLRQLTLPPLYLSHSSPRCRTLMLGPRGTALYVCSNAQASLLSSSLIDAIAAADIEAQSPVPLWNLRMEALAATVLPTSSMHSDEEGVTSRPEAFALPLVTNDTKTGWSCADYDEESGTVALGSGDGRLTLLRLGLLTPTRTHPPPIPTGEPRSSAISKTSDPYSWAASSGELV